MHLWPGGVCRGVNAFNVATTTVVDHGDKARDIKEPEVVKDILILSIVVLDSMDVLRDFSKHPPA